jgi:hypothetical protein
VKKESWLFLIKVALFLLAFGWIWFWLVQDAYPYFLKPVAYPFFQWIGVRKWRLSLLLDHFTNIVPYVTLVCASPGFFKNWKKTLVALFGGLIILMIGHLLLSCVDYYFYSRYKMTKSFFKGMFPFLMLNDALPLGLWLLFYPKVLTEVFSFLKFGRKAETES